MRIGDVAAPGALLRTPTAETAGASFVQTFGSVQRAFRERRPPPLHEVPERQQRRREIEARAERLREAARSLSEAAPKAEFTTLRETGPGEVERVATRRELTTETELQTEATPARQASWAFADPDAKIAGKGSQLELGLGPGDPKLKVKVGKEGASLSELAQLVNEDANNAGRVTARIVADGSGSRLVIETNQTGSEAVLSVRIDDFQTPEGDDFALIDPALARQGQDESTETVTATEIVEGSRRRVRLREIETKHQVEDEEFSGRVAEFVEAYNSLKTFSNAENLDLGDDYGLLGSDERVRDVMRALAELADGLAERASESGTTLAEIGIALDDAGLLQLDGGALQQAIASDTTAVVELLNASEGGLAADAAATLAGPASKPADPTAGLQGFLGSLSTQQGRLEARLGLLEDVVSALSQGPSGEEA